MLDITTSQDFILKSAWALPLVTGLVEVIKRATDLPSRFLPLVSLIIGLLVGVVVIDLSVIGGTVGVVLGLAGVGLWEFGKTTVAGASSKKTND